MKGSGRVHLLLNALCIAQSFFVFKVPQQSSRLTISLTTRIATTSIEVERGFVHQDGMNKIKYLKRKLDLNNEVSFIDIADGIKCAWDYRDPILAVSVLEIAKAANASIKRAGMYDVMRIFCDKERYDLIEHTLLHIFPLTHQYNPLSPTDRLKWQCRYLTEYKNMEEAFSLIAKASSENLDVSYALKTVLQTASRIELHKDAIHAYEMLSVLKPFARNITSNEPEIVDNECFASSEDILNAYDLRAVIRSANALRNGSLVLTCFDRWLNLVEEADKEKNKANNMSSTLNSEFVLTGGMEQQQQQPQRIPVNTKKPPLPHQNVPRPSMVHINQAVSAALSLRNISRALALLDPQFISSMGATPDDFTRNLTQRLERYTGRVQSTIGNSKGNRQTLHTSDKAVTMGTGWKNNAISVVLEDRGGPDSKLEMLAQALAQGVYPSIAATTTLLRSFAESRDPKSVEKLLTLLRSHHVPLNAYHYAVLVKFYGSAGKQEEVSSCLEQAKKEGVVPDTVLYTSVIDALSLKIAANGDDGGVLGMCAQVFREALSSSVGEAVADLLLSPSFPFPDDEEPTSPSPSLSSSDSDGLLLPVRLRLQNDSVLRDRLLALFNTYMRPLGKRGDVLSSERIYNGLFLLGMAPDNVTLSARLTAYASSGRVSVC